MDCHFRDLPDFQSSEAPGPDLGEGRVGSCPGAPTKYDYTFYAPGDEVWRGHYALPLSVRPSPELVSAQ